MLSKISFEISSDNFQTEETAALGLVAIYFDSPVSLEPDYR
jgi:hypothetical protein